MKIKFKLGVVYWIRLILALERYSRKIRNLRPAFGLHEILSQTKKKK